MPCQGINEIVIFIIEWFKSKKESSEKGGKLKYYMNDLLPYGKVGHEAFLVFLGYLYTGKHKPFPMEVSTCVDNVCVHNACRPAINFAVKFSGLLECNFWYIAPGHFY